MARNKKVEILSNGQEVLHPITDGDCVIFSDGRTLAQKLSEDDSVKYTPEVTNSSPMFKVGEGNTVDYSDNVLDGAYERATLQGQTYVNYIQESSADEVTLPTPFTEYERTQHNTLTSNEEGVLGINLVGQSYVNALQHDSEEEFVVLGESLEFQEKKVEYTNEGQIKSAMLKGQTLVNLASNQTKTFTVKDFSTRTLVIHELGKTTNIKPNTKYLLSFRVSNLVLDGQTSIGLNFNNSLDDSMFQGVASMRVPQNGIHKSIVTTNTSEMIKQSTLLIKGDANEWENTNSTTRSLTISDIQLIEYQEGMENWDIPYFEGMQSVTVSTRLENLCHKYNDGLAKNGKTFNTNSLSDRCIKLVDYKDSAEATYGMKPNTKYLVQFKISNLVLDGLEGVGLQFSVGESDSTNYLFKNATKHGLITANGIYRVVLTTTDLVSTSGVEIKGIGTEWENSGSTLRSLTISNIMYVEYQNGMENWDLPYFEDYQVMKSVQVESINKNIVNFYDSTVTSHGVTATITNSVWKITGTSDSDGGRNATYRYSTILKAGKTYVFTLHDLVENKDSVPGIYVSNSTTGVAILKVGLEGGIVKTESNYTPTEDTPVHIWFNRYNGATYDTTFKLMLEESDAATSYVPHQSKITYSWDEVILRKVGDVEDTLDLTTGEWVQRIGEIVLNGSENWATNNESTTKTIRFILKDTPMDSGVLGQDYSTTINQYECDKLQKVAWNETTPLGITHTEHIIFIYNNSIENSAEGIKQWLKSNPIKIQYILEKPIVHKVNLSRPNLQVYDDITHVHTKCLDGTLIPNIYLPSDISYPAILEPGKKYNVCVNHTEVSADNPLKVNVGGTEITMTDSRMTLTTPSTLANSNVSFTGKGNKIKESMLIKNSSLLTGDLPHFNGIGSVQLGKTIENLCESRISSIGNSTMPTWNLFDDHIEFTTTSTGSRVIASKLLKPLKNGKKYFVYAPNNYPTNVVFAFSFSEYFNNGASFTRDAVEMKGSSKYAIIEPNQKNILYREVVVGNHGSLPAGTYKIDYPIICEYEHGMENWDWESIGYFTGTKNIGNEFMRVQNKNLININANNINNYFENILPGALLNTYDNGKLTANNYTGASHGKGVIVSLKPNTQYIITARVTNSGCISIHDRQTKVLYDIRTTNTKLGRRITTNDNTEYCITFATVGSSTNEKAIFEEIQLEESSTDTTYTAHKENTLYVRKDQPIELTWEQGRINPSGIGDSYTNAINNAVSYGIRTKGLLNLKPNTTYRISLGNKANYKYHIAVFDNWDNALASTSLVGISGDWVSSKDTIFTTTKDAHKIGINVQKQDVSSITPSEINHVRLEEVTDVVLRSIGNVYDELDITRGIYTQRIDEIILDGSDDESWGYNANYDLFVYFGVIGNYNFITTNDKLSITTWEGSFRYTIKASQNEITSATTGRQFLSNNPIKIQYVLKTPIVHKVYIGNKNEANTEVTKPNDVFTLPTLYTEQTHIDLTNNGIMPKVQSRDYIAYPVLPMIGRTYTLQHNLTGGVSNLTVDLLGRTQSVSYQNHKSLVYTPESLVSNIKHKELRISGKGKISGVMYIDGGYMDRDIPYIEGMKNAVNPIVKNIGKNLISFDNMYSSYIKNGSLSCVNNTITRLKDGYNDMQLYIYLVNGKHYYFGLDGSIGVGGVQQPKIVFGKMRGWREFPEQQRIAPNKDFIYRGQTGWTTLHMVNINYINDIYITEVQGHENCEPYKENICYVDCGEIRLTPDMFEQGNIVYNGANAGATYDSMKQASNIRVRMKELIEIKPNTKYLLDFNGGYRVFVREFDQNQGKLNDSALSLIEFQSRVIFTTNANAQYISLLIGRLDETSLPLSDFNKLNLLLIEKDNMVILRSLPNGVHDEIDLETGKYIQRVGEIIFDGSDDEQWSRNTFSNNDINERINRSIFDIQVDDASLNNDGKVATNNNKLANEQATYLYSYNATKALEGVGNPTKRIRIAVLRDKLYSDNSIGFKQYLSENPITVQYELAEPIVKDIVIHNYPHSYEGGHVIIESGDPNTPIPTQITYRAVTNRSGQIQQHTEQVEKQEQEINELEMLILANISNQTRS